MLKAHNIEKILIIIIGVTLFSIILSHTILNKPTLLIYFYTISFVFQILAISLFLYRKNITIKKTHILILGIYLFTLFLPIITNVFLNIKTNYYDFLSIFFKFFNFIIFFCLFKRFVVTKSQIKKLMWYIIVIGIISCLYNFIFCFSDIEKIITATSSYQVDIRSFFVQRNMFGEFLFISLLSTFYYYEGKKSRVKLLLMFIFILNTILTFSRGSIFSVIILVCYMTLLKYKNSKKSILLLIISSLLIIIFLFSSAFNYFEIFILRSDNFYTGRDIIWQYGYNIFKINPFNGVGYYTAINMSTSIGLDHSQFHSFFIDSLAGYGIIGLIFNLSILFISFSLYFKKIKLKNNYYLHCFVVSCVILFIKMFIESISFFSVGYSDLITTFYYISLPSLLANMNYEGKE